MKKKIIIGALILAVITGLVLGFTVFNHEMNSSFMYKTEEVYKGDVESQVVTTGTLNPVILVDVGSQVSGKIEEIYADFNSEVKAGQVIAKIEQSSFLTRVQQNEANYKGAVASLEKAKVNLKNIGNKYDRSLELFEKELISYEEKESAEAQYLTAKADLQSVEAKLEQAKSLLDSSKVDLAYTVITSPIDGIVINKNVNMGQTVAASFQAPILFQIANDLSKMQVECSIDEADIGKLKENQKVRFTVDAFPDESFTGIVEQVRYSPDIIQNVVTYTTIVEVENPNMKLRPGMTATVYVIVEEAKDILLIPNSALRFTPQLKPEEMEDIFSSIQQEKQAGSNGESPIEGQTNGEKNPKSERPIAEGRGVGLETAKKKDVSRVWILGDNGQLKPVVIKTGVTDNSYTGVVTGNLGEGQQVITGLLSGNSNNLNPNNRDSMRNMIRTIRK